MYTHIYTYVNILYIHIDTYIEERSHSESRESHLTVPTPDPCNDGSAGARYNSQPDIHGDIIDIVVCMSCPHRG